MVALAQLTCMTPAAVRTAPFRRGQRIVARVAAPEAPVAEVEKESVEVEAAAPAPAPATPAPAPTLNITPPAAPTFNEVFAFDGLAPEIVNGRLAMLGFVAAVGAELASGQSLGQQFASNAGGAAFLFTAQLFAMASVITMYKGIRNDEAFGPLTPAAELYNGRAAMCGIAALLLVEAIKGSALF